MAATKPEEQADAKAKPATAAPEQPTAADAGVAEPVAVNRFDEALKQETAEAVALTDEESEALDFTSRHGRPPTGWVFDPAAHPSVYKAEG